MSAELKLTLLNTRKWLWIMLCGAGIIELIFVVGFAMEASRLFQEYKVQGLIRSVLVLLSCVVFVGIYLYKLGRTIRAISSNALAVSTELGAIQVCELLKFQAIVTILVGGLVGVTMFIPAY